MIMLIHQLDSSDNPNTHAVSNNFNLKPTTRELYMISRKSNLIAAIMVAACSFSSVALADDIKVYFNHDVNAPAVKANLEDEIIRFINDANNTIEIAVYDLDLPGIAQALVNAKDRGVIVRFITDEDNITGDNALALSILDAGGVPWIDDTENGSAGSRIQHNKFIISDSRMVLTGSTNFSQSGIHGDLDVNGQLINEGNDNHIMTIDSTQLSAQFITQFNLMWGDGQGGAKDSLFGLGKPDHYVTTTYTTNDNIRVDVQFTPQSPTIFAGSSIETLVNYVSDANERVYLAQFVISSQDVADAMKLRHDDGVEILGLGDSSFFSRYYSEFMDMEGTAKLNNNGVFESDSYTGAPNNPWENPADVRIAKMQGGDKFHQKYFIIDDMTISGSHNVSGAAAFGNDENIVAVFDVETASEMEGHFVRAFCEAAYRSDCAQAPAPIYSAGTYEGVYFTSAQVAVVIDIVNNATLAQLDDDANMNKRAAKSIIAARTIESMEQLVDVKYVGGAAMQDLYDYMTAW